MRRLPVAAFLLFVLAVAASPAWAQAPVTSTTPISGSGQPVDPSKNVLDALLAAVTRLNDLVASYVKRQDDLREEMVRFQNAMRDGETRRVNELAAQKQNFDLELSRIRDKSVDANALLLATQVKELKADSSERTAKLEQFANEMRGRTSATDPANVKLLEEVAILRTQRANATGSDAGRAEIWALLGVLGMLLLAAIGVILNLMKRHDTRAIAEDVVRRTNGNGHDRAA